ncbi:hypothetical protein ACFQFQ_12815 [Sulfitobacter porphyrae]|uniref:Uncharacterized protein n=1 Tax=Sulfitobacter porphyrae TaxID=1246864 RepID=A0ABW2B3A2_9RHOB
MQLILHTGAHYTEQDRLIKSMLRNAAQFRERGIMIPGPGTYRKLVRDTLNAMHRALPGPMRARCSWMSSLMMTPPNG